MAKTSGARRGTAKGPSHSAANSTGNNLKSTTDALQEAAEAARAETQLMETSSIPDNDSNVADDDSNAQASSAAARTNTDDDSNAVAPAPSAAAQARSRATTQQKEKDDHIATLTKRNAELQSLLDARLSKVNLRYFWECCVFVDTCIYYLHQRSPDHVILI